MALISEVSGLDVVDSGIDGDADVYNEDRWIVTAVLSLVDVVAEDHHDPNPAAFLRDVADRID